MKNTGHRLLLSLTLITLCAFPSFASAIDIIEARTSPETPDAFEQVRIRLISFTTDLAASLIVWSVDGRVVAEGPSLTEFSVQAGDYGESLDVAATIITPQGERITKNVLIAPVGIDLLWEAQGYTPPFYKGKARPVAFSKVKVAAFPRFNTTFDDPRKYAYAWFIRDNTSVGEGLGKNSTLIEAPRAGQSLAIRANVYTPDRKRQGEKRTEIKSGLPVIRFYEFTPLSGLRLETPLGNEGVPVSAETTSVRVVPYYFSSENVDAGELRIDWSVDGATVRPGADIMQIDVAAPEKSGSRSIKAVIDNIRNPFQSAEGKTSIGFIRK